MLLLCQRYLWRRLDEIYEVEAHDKLHSTSSMYKKLLQHTPTTSCIQTTGPNKLSPTHTCITPTPRRLLTRIIHQPVASRTRHSSALFCDARCPERLKWKVAVCMRNIEDARALTGAGEMERLMIMCLRIGGEVQNVAG